MNTPSFLDVDLTRLRPGGWAIAAIGLVIAVAVAGFTGFKLSSIGWRGRPAAAICVPLAIATFAAIFWLGSNGLSTIGIECVAREDAPGDTEE